MTTTSRDRRWADVAAVARRYGWTEYAVRSRVARGTLPHRRVGRRLLFDLDELDRFIDETGLSAEEARANLEARAPA